MAESDSLAVALIERIDAIGSYAQIHLPRRVYEIRETLLSLEKKLDPARFVRIHEEAAVPPLACATARAAGRGTPMSEHDFNY